MVWPVPTLPGETGRVTRTTTAGTTFVDVSFTIGADTCRVHIPQGYDTTIDLILFVAMHGHGGDASYIDGSVTPQREPQLDAGHIWVSSLAADKAWGNDAAQQAYVDVAAWSAANVRQHEHVILQGSSMGGLTAALVYANDAIPLVRGASLVDAAVNLEYAYGKEPYTSAIRAAYGIATDAEYATKTAGHDAVKRAADFAGTRLLMVASYGDTSIEQAQNADLFMSRLGSIPERVDFIQASGPHVDPSHYPAGPFESFVRAAIYGDPPPDRTVTIPTGIEEVQMYTRERDTWVPAFA